GAQRRSTKDTKNTKTRWVRGGREIPGCGTGGGSRARWGLGSGGGLALAVLAGLLSACGAGPGAPLTPASPALGSSATAPPVAVHLTEAPFAGYLAPDFTLPDTAGQPITLHSYRGHPV